MNSFMNGGFAFMNINEFYNVIEGNYDDVLKRLMKEQRIVKYVSKFTTDKSYDELISTLSEKNYPDAFRAAHTLKGISQNLGFDRLYDASAELSDLLRNGDCKNPERTDELVKILGEEYDRIISAAGMLED